MKSNKSLRIFLFGLLFVGICINVETGIPTAFKLAEGSGLTGFLVYKLNEILNGNSFSIDIFFDPIGYVLMLIGVKQLGGKLSKGKLITALLSVAMVINIASTIIPLTVSEGSTLIKLIVGTYVVEGVALLFAMTRFVQEVKSKVDPYYNMEVGKDLVFATELFFFAYFVIIIVVFACAIDLFFADIVLILDYAAMIYSIVYFIYKTDSYNKKLKIFE